MSQVICYEQPLNERTRALLRLEFLFQQMEHALAGQSVWDSRAALQGLFDILAVTGRSQFKKELLKELERHATTLSRLQQSPSVDDLMLSDTLAEIGEVIHQIHRANSIALEIVRQNEFLGVAQQRFQVPGGACPFDLPALHYWLQQELEVRNRYLREWFAPFVPMQAAVFLILRLIRNSATQQPEVAVNGFFQRALDANMPNQLVRVWLSTEESRFPEISGGQHRLTIRFLEQPDPNRRAIASTVEVAFQWACCVM